MDLKNRKLILNTIDKLVEQNKLTKAGYLLNIYKLVYIEEYDLQSDEVLQWIYDYEHARG